MYSLKYLEDGEKQAAKGVLSSVRRSQLRHDSYKDALFGELVLSHLGRKIVKNDNKLYSAAVYKVSLSCFTDKIHIERVNDQFVCNSLGFYPA